MDEWIQGNIEASFSSSCFEKLIVSSEKVGFSARQHFSPLFKLQKRVTGEVLELPEKSPDLIMCEHVWDSSIVLFTKMENSMRQSPSWNCSKTGVGWTWFDVHKKICTSPSQTVLFRLVKSKADSPTNDQMATWRKNLQLYFCSAVSICLINAMSRSHSHIPCPEFCSNNA